MSKVERQGYVIAIGLVVAFFAWFVWRNWATSHSDPDRTTVAETACVERVTAAFRPTLQELNARRMQRLNAVVATTGRNTTSADFDAQLATANYANKMDGVQVFGAYCEVFAQCFPHKPHKQVTDSCYAGWASTEEADDAPDAEDTDQSSGP